VAVVVRLEEEDIDVVVSVDVLSAAAIAVWDDEEIEFRRLEILIVPLYVIGAVVVRIEDGILLHCIIILRCCCDVDIGER
jgi:hypothetical protein